MTTISNTHAGHGGLVIGSNPTDPGALSRDGRTRESDIARRINKMIIDKIGVPNTSDEYGRDVNGILYNTVANMNRIGRDYHISNHLNAFNNSANGVEVWYWLGDEPSRVLAEKISKAISDTLGIVNRGAKPTMDLYVLRNSNGRTLLIEWCFIDNDNDLKKLLGNMDGAVNSMLKCFGYSVNSKPSKPNKPVEKPIKPTEKPQASSIPPKGAFTLSDSINLRTSPDTTSKVIATLKSGDTINYDKVLEGSLYTWIRQPRSGGKFGYMAVGKKNKTVTYYGKFK